MSKERKNDPNVDCDCFTPKSCAPVRNVTHPLRYYEFTQEEMKALEECDRESFYQRCLPISTLFATITYAAIKAVTFLPIPSYFYEYFLILGILQRSPHFGVFPKVIVAAIMGYFTGRASYIPQCDQKIRHKLPANSHLRKTMQMYYDEANPPPPPIKK